MLLHKLRILGSQVGALLAATFWHWTDDKAPRLSAALAYYTVVSMAPLLIVVIYIVGLALGPEAAQGQIVEQTQYLIGQRGAEAVEGVIANARKPATGLIASILGVLTLLFGASGVFNELQDALNTIWAAPPRKDQGFSIVRLIKGRFYLFLVVLGTGFLLLVSLVLSAWISAFAKYLSSWLPKSALFLEATNFIVSFAVTTILFAVMYKVLPDAYVAWSDVWIGAAVTALLFTLGKSLIGIYLGRSGVTSVYGAAGSLVLILIWVYYSAQVFYFGAEFTQVYACKYGSRYWGVGPGAAEERPAA